MIIIYPFAFRNEKWFEILRQISIIMEYMPLISIQNYSLHNHKMIHSQMKIAFYDFRNCIHLHSLNKHIKTTLRAEMKENKTLNSSLDVFIFPFWLEWLRHEQSYGILSSTLHAVQNDWIQPCAVPLAATMTTAVSFDAFIK